MHTLLLFLHIHSPILTPLSFFSGCHLFIPLFDPAYDTYEGLLERTPWTIDAILAIAGKIRSGTGPPTPTFYKCLEEAQGIARSSLFGPVVRKEAVQGGFAHLFDVFECARMITDTQSFLLLWFVGMLLLAAWSTNGWLPSGHAMRMALDLGLHRALEKLADEAANGGKHRSEEEERDLGTVHLSRSDSEMSSDSMIRVVVVSARIWLCLYWFDHQ